MIGQGDRILLSGEGRRFYVRAGSGQFSTDLGIFNLDEAVGARPGDRLTSHNGRELVIVLPRAADFFEFSRRSGAPMLPRDIGMVIAYTGMNRNDEVLDSGTGTGIAAIYFGGIAKRVVTCESRTDFATIARRNISDTGLDNVEVVAEDFLSATGSYDIVHLDMTISAEHIRHAYSLLKPGGYLACYTPFLEYLFLVMDEAGDLFAEIRSVEIIEREISRTKRGTRPSTRIGHSGYLTVARRM